MANITVRELLLDADFVDPCIVVRQFETVGDDGMQQVHEVRYRILASLQASSGDSLLTLPDASRASSTYECITDFPLLAPTDLTTNADIVIWRGMRFRVTAVAVFANFAGGKGHYEATMEMLPVRVGYNATAMGGGQWDNGQTGWDDGKTLWDPAAGSVGHTEWDNTTTLWDS